MKLFHRAKDGGPESTVTGYWLIEWKSVFSIALLRFAEGSRSAYHNHAFNAISWVLKGHLREEICGGPVRYYHPSLLSIITLRSTFHRAGWHVALGGGVLLRGWSNHDLDLIVYPHSSERANLLKLRKTLQAAGMVRRASAAAVQEEWRKLGSRDCKHVEVWRTADARRVDIIVPSETV